MADAEGRILAFKAQLEDDDLADRAETFINEARRWTQHRQGGDRAALMAAADALSVRAREVLAKK